MNPPVSVPDVIDDGVGMELELNMEPKLNNGGAFGEPNGRICGALALALSAGVDWGDENSDEELPKLNVAFDCVVVLDDGSNMNDELLLPNENGAAGAVADPNVFVSDTEKMLADALVVVGVLIIGESNEIPLEIGGGTELSEDVTGGISAPLSLNDSNGVPDSKGPAELIENGRRWVDGKVPAAANCGPDWNVLTELVTVCWRLKRGSVLVVVDFSFGVIKPNDEVVVGTPKLNEVVIPDVENAGNAPSEGTAALEELSLVVIGNGMLDDVPNGGRAA